MIYLIWLLRIIHIVGGVFWVGGTLIMTFFVGPTAGATGEAGQKFVGHLMNNLKFSNRMAIASGLTILAGLILYVRGGSPFFESRFGIGLGIGAVFALIGFFSGMMIGRTLKAMAELGAQIQGKPSTEQRSRMQALQRRQATVSMISTVSVLLATVLMAIARYL
jgi:uncharacterized membrane protein